MKLQTLSFFACLLVGAPCSAQQNPFPVSEDGLEYLSGQALFEKIWVSAPASTKASDGLGPLYNARSCAQCHQSAGKGSPEPGLVYRIADERYGAQLQTRAVRGLGAEPRIMRSYSTNLEVLNDSVEVMLHQPIYEFADQGTGLLPFSPRLATSLAGVGLLESIPLAALLARADPDDSNNDGISGRAGKGRFGWKADVGSLEEQLALALSLDIGISSELKPNPMGDCTRLQEECLMLPNGASVQDANLEIGRTAFMSLLHFVRNIPVMTDVNAEQNRHAAGQQLFQEIGCQDCHQTGYLNGQINPYSDLLLHDMGDRLADTLEDSMSREWRTAPLWGLAAYSLSDEQYYLHDGRARSLIEAILWHGGEAESTKQAFAALSSRDREDLISFLQGI